MASAIIGGPAFPWGRPLTIWKGVFLISLASIERPWRYFEISYLTSKNGLGVTNVFFHNIIWSDFLLGQVMLMLHALFHTFPRPRRMALKTGSEEEMLPGFREAKTQKFEKVRQVTLETKFLENHGKPHTWCAHWSSDRCFVFETSGKQGFPSFPEFSMGKKVTHSSFMLGAFVSGNEEQFADKAVYCSVPAVLNVWGTQFCEVARRFVSV